MKAVIATRVGGPEVLEVREVPEPVAQPGQVLIRVRSAGVNFADTMATAGRYAGTPPPPLVPGLEVAGEEVGTGTPVLALVGTGGYAELVAADGALVFPAPGMDLDLAGGWPLVTSTAWIALSEAGRLRPGETVMVTAGAGGLGTAAIQLSRALGAGRVVAVTSTAEKRAFALDHGADAAIGYGEPFPQVDLVFDAVGGPTAQQAIAATRHLGRVLLIGAASGHAPEIPGFAELRERNVGVFCFSFGALRRADPERAASLLDPGLDLLRSGEVRLPPPRILPLEEAAEAHRLLLSRRTTGKLVLRP